jgi:hypothetical protein
VKQATIASRPVATARCVFPTPGGPASYCRASGFEVRIHYPFHPRHSETIVSVGAKRHAGAEHLIVRQPDDKLAALPHWMTQPEAALRRLIPSPRLPVARLAGLRALRIVSSRRPASSIRLSSWRLDEEGLSRRVSLTSVADGLSSLGSHGNLFG